MPVMKVNSSMTTRRGYTFLQNAQVNRTTLGALGNYMFSGLTAVTTSSGPKPKTLVIHDQFFRKLAWVDQDRVEVSRGIYLGKPETQATHNYAHSYMNALFGGFYADARKGEANWASLEARSLEKLLEKMRGDHANVAVDFAERHQTIDMIRKSLRLKKLVAEFVEGTIQSRTYKRYTRQKRFKRRADYVSGKWLEYRYGWQPLIGSIYDLAEQLHKRRVAAPVWVKARSGTVQEMRDQRGKLNAPGSDPLVWGLIKGSYRVERCAYYNRPGDSISDFTSLNPLAIAWELVPFSFIADWFVGVGQCLENWENYWMFRNSYVTGYITWTTKEDRSAQQYAHYTNNYLYWPNGTIIDGVYQRAEWSSAQCVYKYKERMKLSSLPAPGWPRVKLGLSSNQMLDIAALISTSVKRVK